MRIKKASIKKNLKIAPIEACRKWSGRCSGDLFTPETQIDYSVILAVTGQFAVKLEFASFQVRDISRCMISTACRSAGPRAPECRVPIGRDPLTSSRVQTRAQPSTRRHLITCCAVAKCPPNSSSHIVKPLLIIAIFPTFIS